MDIEKYIFSVIDAGAIVGQAFCADNYLITAAHIYTDYPSSYILQGQHKILLSGIKSSIIYMGKGDFYNDPKEFDVVVFYMEWIKSPLHLSEYTPQRTDILNSCCVEWEEDRNKLNPISKVTTEKVYPLGEDEENYFYCYSKRFHGSSGSPLLKENEVVGIMQGGDEKGLCAFLKVSNLLEIIYKDEVCLAYCSADSRACEGEDPTWLPYSQIIKKNGKIGVVVNSEGSRNIIIPFRYDTWFSLDGQEGIWQDFFDDYEQYYGYFAIKNPDGTFTCHGFDKEGHTTESFTCESFNKDVTRLNGKTYIGRKAEGDGYDDVKRMGYYYGQLGNDNCYFALCKGNKWSLKSSDLKETYLDNIECDGFHEMGWTLIGYYVILKKADKYQLYIGSHNNNPLFLSKEYDYIEMRYYIPKDDFHVKALCFALRKGNKYAVCSNDLQYISPFVFDKVGNMVDSNNIIVMKVFKGQEVQLNYRLTVDGDWKIKDFRPFDANEIAAVERAEVVANLHGNSVCFFMKGGGQTYIPLSEQSKLSVGDNLDLKTAKILTLSKKGKDDITRVIERQ